MSCIHSTIVCRVVERYDGQIIASYEWIGYIIQNKAKFSFPLGWERNRQNSFMVGGSSEFQAYYIINPYHSDKISYSRNLWKPIFQISKWWEYIFQINWSVCVSGVFQIPIIVHLNYISTYFSRRHLNAIWPHLMLNYHKSFCVSSAVAERDLLD